MKITLNIMDLSGLRYSWNTIYIALLHDFIEVNEVEKYAMKVMALEDYEENEFINDLAWGGKEKIQIINMMLEGELVKNIKKFEKYELNKIKYMILFYLKKQFNDSPENLLRKIEEVYADVGYPEDMSSFIYYMPNNDKSILTKKEKELNMILKFDKYLKNLKNEIETTKA